MCSVLDASSMASGVWKIRRWCGACALARIDAWLA